MITERIIIPLIFPHHKIDYQIYAYMKKINITIKHLSEEKTMEIPYNSTIKDVINAENIGFKAYNIHDKLLPLNMPIRGHMIIRLKEN